MESGVILFHMPLTDISGENFTLVLETRARIEMLRQQNISLLEALKAEHARVGALEGLVADLETLVNVLRKRLKRIGNASIVLLYGLGTVAAIVLSKGCAR